MKNILSFGLALVAVYHLREVATAADLVDGSYNTTFGYLAGKNESAGDRVTAFGAGAYGNGNAGQSSVFFGAASGTFSTNLNECAGIGYRSFRGATDMNRCVGIGSEAFMGETNVSDATWINGQIYVGKDKFWIKSSRDVPDNESTIYFDGTNLRLNAAKVYVADGTLLLPLQGSDEERSYSFYVSSESGDDEKNDGTTMITPFKTLDRACQAVRDGGVVGVMKGEYAYPAYYATNLCTGAYSYEADLSNTPKRVSFVSLEGARLTKIVSGLVPPVETRPTSSEWGGGSDGRLVGSMRFWTEFRGFTFKHMNPIARHYKSAPGIMYVKFRECVFDGIDVSSCRYIGVFTGCWLKDCKFRNCVFRNGGGMDANNIQYNPRIFDQCLVEGSVLSFTGDSANGYVNLSHRSTFVNDVFDIDGGIRSLELRPTRNSSTETYLNDAFGTNVGAFDTTLVCTNVTAANGEYSMSGLPLPLCGCLFGVDGFTNEANRVSSIVTNCSAVADSLDHDSEGGLRPNRAKTDHPEWRRWWFYGYGSGVDRAARDSVAEELYTTLAESETVAESVRSVASQRASSLGTESVVAAEARTNIVSGVYVQPFEDGKWTATPPELTEEDKTETEAAENGATET